MKIRMLLILALGFTGAVAHAGPANPLTVAVYGFTSPKHQRDNYGDSLTTLITADLTTNTNLVMLERAQLPKALKEQAFGVSGLVNPEAAAQIGQITGAKVLVHGQIIKTGGNHLVVVADIIGTETGRLFADQVEGPANHLLDLASNLSGRIAGTISDQASNLVAAVPESSADRLARILKGITGTNRPGVSVDIFNPNAKRQHNRGIEDEFGIVLLKAGFSVVDSNSDRKPDVEITGVNDVKAGPREDGLYTYKAIIELKVQKRLTGKIVTFDRQEATATDATKNGASRSAVSVAVGLLAERILPLLAQ